MLRNRCWNAVKVISHINSRSFTKTLCKLFPMSSTKSKTHWIDCALNQAPWHTKSAPSNEQHKITEEVGHVSYCITSRTHVAHCSCRVPQPASTSPHIVKECRCKCSLAARLMTHVQPPLTKIELHLQRFEAICRMELVRMCSRVCKWNTRVSCVQYYWAVLFYPQ